MIDFHVTGDAKDFVHIVGKFMQIVERYDGGDPAKFDLVARVSDDFVDDFTDACDEHGIHCEML